MQSPRIFLFSFSLRNPLSEQQDLCLSLGGASSHGSGSFVAGCLLFSQTLPVSSQLFWVWVYEIHPARACSLLLCCLCLWLPRSGSQDPPIHAGCMSTLLPDKDCARAQVKLPWITWPFPLPGVLPGLELREKFALSAKTCNILAAFCGMQESWAETQVPCRSQSSFHTLTFCWCSSQAPNCLHWIFKEIFFFFGNAGLSSRMLKGLGSTKEKLGAACCNPGFSHRREPTEGFVAEYLQLCPGSHLSTCHHIWVLYFSSSM